MKSVILIGNGGSLRDSNLGNKIDEFDEVIRINDWKTNGWEKDAGLKTTIWSMYNPQKGAVNFLNSYTTLKGYDIDTIKGIVNGINEIWYVSWDIDNLVNTWRAKRPIKNLGVYGKCKRHQSVVNSKSMRRKLDTPSTGMMLILILIDMYDKIYLAGFDFAGNSDNKLINHHYYGNKSIKTIQEIEIHNPKSEYEFVNRLIKENKVEYLTVDTKIEKSNFKGKMNKYKCSKCGMEGELYDWEQPICNYCEEFI